MKQSTPTIMKLRNILSNGLENSMKLRKLSAQLEKTFGALERASKGHVTPIDRHPMSSRPFRLGTPITIPF